VLRAVLIGTIVLGAIVPRASAQARVHSGSTPPGYAIVVAPVAGAPVTLCADDCTLELPGGETRVGWRRADREIEWQTTLALTEELRIDIVLEDRSAYRTVAYSLLAAAGILLAATAIVGIATEPERPDMGWFGERHGLVFAGIAGGVVLAFGVPGVALAVAFESDAPAVRAVPMDAIPADDG